MALLTTLLAYARSPSAHVEDPITEILAWVIASSPGAARAVVRCLDEPLTRRGHAALPAGQPTVATQVVVAKGTPDGGRCDLVLTWHAEAVVAIVEVKVAAGLTVTTSDEKGAQHQIARYLAHVASDPTRRGVVLLLGPSGLDVGASATNPAYGGHVVAQRVHDALGRAKRDGAIAEPHVAWVVGELLTVMEESGMATPTMTFEGLTSVYRFYELRGAVVEAFKRARESLWATDAPLAGFYKRRFGLQDDWRRLGYPIFADASDGAAYAFVGMYFGDEPLHDGVPDAYFFLCARPGSGAAKRARTWIAGRPDVLGALRAHRADITWQTPDEPSWFLAIARASLATILTQDDPGAALVGFFLDAAKAAEAVGLLAAYVEAVKGGASTEPVTPPAEDDAAATP